MLCFRGMKYLWYTVTDFTLSTSKSNDSFTLSGIQAPRGSCTVPFFSFTSK